MLNKCSSENIPRIIFCENDFVKFHILFLFSENYFVDIWTNLKISIFSLILKINTVKFSDAKHKGKSNIFYRPYGLRRPWRPQLDMGGC